MPQLIKIIYLFIQVDLEKAHLGKVFVFYVWCERNLSVDIYIL